MSDWFNKSSETSAMSSVAEASDLIRSLAEPYPAGDRVKTAMWRAGRKLNGWSPNRVRDIWHADRRVRVSSVEMDQLRAAACQQKEAHVADKLAAFSARLAKLEEALAEERAHRNR